MIILDRDGVINYESADYIKSPEEWHAIPGSLEAIARLTQAGHQVVIMTNQSGIGRGYYDEAMLTQIHAKLLAQLAERGGRIAKIFYCPHHPDAGCDCRKPEPGMLKQIEAEFNVNWDECLLIGDSWRDIEAGRAVGCEGWLVRTGFGESFVANKQIPRDVPVFPDLSAAVDYFLLTQIIPEDSSHKN